MTALEIIEVAFASRTSPERVTEANAPLSEVYSDARAFEGKNWRSVNCGLLDTYPDCVHGFSPKAFCYFLPGIFSAGIRENRPDLIVNHSLIMTLDRGNASGTWDDFFKLRWPTLTQLECGATQQWIFWLSDQKPSAFSDSELSRALDTMELLSNRSLAEPIAGRWR